jgi:hypothetical protein
MSMDNTCNEKRKLLVEKFKIPLKKSEIFSHEFHFPQIANIKST